MPEATTRVVVNVTRHETCTYELEGMLSEEEAREIIESGEDPDESRILNEDIDVVVLEHIAGDEEEDDEEDEEDEDGDA